MTETFAILALSAIRQSITNPRTTFNEKALAELAESIRAKGVIQPLLVRSAGDEYELVCGERRYRAAELAGITEVPCMIRDLSDVDVLEVQIIENDQREDVHPLEQAKGYQLLVDIGQTTEEIAAKIGRPKRYVVGRLALNNLGEDGRRWLTEGKIHLGTAIDLAKSGMEADYIKRNGSFVSDSNVHWFIRHAHPSLEDARFPLDDISLNPEMGSCLGCQFNSACNPSLFGDDDDASKGRCTKRACFDQKLDTWIFNQLRTVPGLRALTKDGDADFGWNILIGPKDEPEEFPLVGIYTLNDNRKGAMVRFKERDVKDSLDHRQQEAAEARKQQKALHEKRRKAHASIFSAIRDNAMPEIDRAIIEAFIVYATRDGFGDYPAWNLDLSGTDGEEDVLLAKLKEASMTDVVTAALHTLEDCEESSTGLSHVTKWLANAAGVDAEAIWDAAQKAE